MYINKQRLRELMNTEASGNYNEFARQLSVNVAQLHRVLNTERQAGPKFLGKLKLYCEKKLLSFDNYIFLQKPLHAVNERCGHSSPRLTQDSSD